MRAVRDQHFMDAARELDERGIRPTGRKIIARLTGKPESAFPQGLGGEDLKAYRRAMLALGYEQDPKTGRWRR